MQLLKPMLAVQSQMLTASKYYALIETTTQLIIVWGILTMSRCAEQESICVERLAITRFVAGSSTRLNVCSFHLGKLVQAMVVFRIEMITIYLGAICRASGECDNVLLPDYIHKKFSSCWLAMCVAEQHTFLLRTIIWQISSGLLTG